MASVARLRRTQRRQGSPISTNPPARSGSLANRAFGTLLGKTSDALLGIRVSTLPWANTDGEPLAEDDRPWRRALRSGQPEVNQRIRLTLSETSY